MWVAAEVLDGPKFMNSTAHAKLLADSGELRDRPSRYAALAKAGVREYEITEEVLRIIQGTRSENGVSATSELQPSEYQDVKRSLEQGLDSKPPPKRRQKEATPIDPRVKELKEANEKRMAALRVMKKNSRRHRNLC